MRATGRQVADRLVELVAFLGIAIGFAVSRFSNPHRLCAHCQPGAVHQRHGIAHQAIAAFAQQLSGCVVVLHLAGGRGMDAQLVLDAPDAHGLVPLDHEERKPAGIAGAGFTACQHQLDIGTAVGDKALDPVDIPLPAGLVESGFGLHRTQV